jgi:hypothetical protein
MVREFLGLALILVGSVSLIAQIIATGRRAAAARQLRQRDVHRIPR